MIPILLIMLIWISNSSDSSLFKQSLKLSFFISLPPGNSHSPPSSPFFFLLLIKKLLLFIISPTDTSKVGIFFVLGLKENFSIN